MVVSLELASGALEVEADPVSMATVKVVVVQTPSSLQEVAMTSVSVAKGSLGSLVLEVREDEGAGVVTVVVVLELETVVAEVLVVEEGLMVEEVVVVEDLVVGEGLLVEVGVTPPVTVIVVVLSV